MVFTMNRDWHVPDSSIPFEYQNILQDDTKRKKRDKKKQRKEKM